jgi:hypothetical protein
MLRDVEGLLARDPEAVGPAFRRAQLLWNLGLTEEAKRAYARVLVLAPDHVEAINNLGAVLLVTGFRRDARICFAQAVSRRPDHPMGHVNLANLLMEEGDLSQAREHYLKALEAAPGLAEAHQGLAWLHGRLGDEETADVHRRLGYGRRPVTVLPYRGRGEPRRILLLLSAGRGNVQLEKFLDDRVYLVTIAFMEYFDPSHPMPPQGLIVNAIGNADLCGPALEAAAALTSRSPSPVVNPPQAVLRTGRVQVSRRLGNIPGLVCPAMENLPRQALFAPDALAARGFSFPLLMRTPGFNNGRHFRKVDGPAGLEAALASLPGQELTAIRFLDARSADGKIRKYRVLFVDGKIYPLHLAVAHDWKIHYHTADMAGSPEHRAEEAAFLEDMEAVLGPVAMKALEAVRQTLGLDYGGADFSLDGGGRVLLFEANATMTVSPPEPGQLWDYRRAAIDRVMQAVGAMIARRAS